MGSRSLEGVRALAVAVVMLVPATATAHAYVMQPPARDLVSQASKDARAHKFGPCGGVPRTNTPTQYDVGAEIEVKWEETIGHSGLLPDRLQRRGRQELGHPRADRRSRQRAGRPERQGEAPFGRELQGLHARCSPAHAQQRLPARRGAQRDERHGHVFLVRGYPRRGLPRRRADDAPGRRRHRRRRRRRDELGRRIDDAHGRRRQDVERRGLAQAHPDRLDEGGCSVAYGATGGFSLFASAGLGLLALARRRRRNRQ